MSIQTSPRFLGARPEGLYITPPRVVVGIGGVKWLLPDEDGATPFELREDGVYIRSEREYSNG